MFTVFASLLIQMLQNMKGQFSEHLMHTGFVSSPDPKDPKSNVNSGALELQFFYLFLFLLRHFIDKHASLMEFPSFFSR